MQYCCCSHHTSVCLLVSTRLMVDNVCVLSTFCHGFMVLYVKLMLSKFPHLWFFTIWLFYSSPKCNLYETWTLHKWGGRHNHSQTRNFFVSCYANRASSSGLMTIPSVCVAPPASRLAGVFTSQSHHCWKSLPCWVHLVYLSLTLVSTDDRGQVVASKL